MKNCHSYSGNIITFFSFIKKIKINIEDSIFNDISTLIDGSYNDISINKCQFYNISSIDSKPILINSPYSNINISNSIYDNITSLRSNLFDDETNYSFMNDTFSNIKSNSNAIIQSTYKPLSISNCKFKNILLNGEIDSSSLIVFNSGDAEKKFIMKNTDIKSCQSNGDLILIKGDTTLIEFSNVSITNVSAYGSILNNISKNSIIEMNNMNVFDNKNINKYKNGLLSSYFNNKMTINNSIFKNNEVKSNGGSLYFSKFQELHIRINSSIFENNHSFNGGAIYIDYFEKESDCEIELLDSKFQHNTADYFGGSVYSSCKSILISNSSFINNHAYSGGGIYIETINDVEKINQFKEIKSTFINNTSYSNGNDFATRPNKINLVSSSRNEITMKSGESYKLTFKVADEFDQIIYDELKYYENINLKIDLVERENNNNLNSISRDDIKIIGNRCSFSKGICELNQLSIYSKYPVILYMEIMIENEGINSNNINIENKNYKFIINDCNDEQIKMNIRENYYYCENPICNDDCPILNKTAICIKSNITNLNNKNYNECQCLPGWKGNKCNLKDFKEISNIYTNILSSPAILITLALMIFMIINRKQRIICDPGFFKCQLILIGMILYFISLNFNIFSNYINCSFHFLLKHCGILLVYIIFLIYISTGEKLGMKFKDLHRLELSLFQTINIKENNNQKNSNSNSETIDINIIEDIEKKINNNILSKENNVSKTSCNSEIVDNHAKIKKLNKDVSHIHSLYTEFSLIYTCVFFIFIFVILLNNKSKDEYIQEYDGKWRYQCPLDKIDFIVSFIELFMIIYLLALVIKIWNYTYVFQCVKYMSYSTILWISIGPIVHLISYISLNKNGFAYNLFNNIINEICYLIMLILYSWDKVYYISKNKGNMPKYYFYHVKRSLCNIHCSYLCECNRNNAVYYNEDEVEKYINFYKYCSVIIVFSNGKFKYIQKKNKNSLKFSI
ncbi:hypothetical protein BCR36DRAFT_359576 [Piromyces finnis]|uniref:EGF-like domain-containing protein n=1 Tax=Piromyces finnis TaxID=1754191 RepID=A0A1Y1V1N5_9FUNG|nr:hypothetical protein BCR36DRAFT_359576 [Piromyces finnis]|eukprot:ORX44484.1 hypothetical protein BCR36DRAFT_359576 [Piromyces finnis]